ncbi:MAG TPA: tetratricopeptide repeat protein [Terriglobales bacterium]|nr:tetratricopeptide repeat protein [Terriglobales bacterium]
MGITKVERALSVVSIFAAAFLIAIATASFAQETGRTVRHIHVQEQDPTADLLTQAETDIDKQDYSSAESLLKKYLDAHSDSYAAWYDLGFVDHALGKNQDSIAAYRKSVAAKPGIFESNLNLGLALANAGDPQAEQFLRTATQLTPNSNPEQGHKRAWMALGHVLESTKSDEAIAAYRQAATLDPRDPEPHLLAGSLLEKQQKPTDAEKEYQQALSADPNSSDALIALSNLYMSQKRFPEAQASLQKLIALHPNDAGAHLQLARMLAISGKNDEAINEMEAGLKLDPNDANAQRDLADLYASSAKYDQAARLYTALLAANPDDATLHFGLGRMFLKEKKFPDAEQELTKAVQLKPQWGEAYGELAVAANENKDYPLAIKAADLRGQYLPENPMSYFLRATAYDHLRDAKDAARYYHQFLGVAGGKYPDQEWQAQHRLIAIEPKK